MALMKFREPNQAKWSGSRPAHNGTQILKYVNADNSVAKIHTANAGVTFYLTHVGITYRALAVGRAELFIADDGDVTQATIFSIITTAAGWSIGQTAAFWPPVEMGAGWYVAIGSNAAGLTVRGFCHGWEE